MHGATHARTHARSLAYEAEARVRTSLVETLTGCRSVYDRLATRACDYDASIKSSLWAERCDAADEVEPAA